MKTLLLAAAALAAISFGSARADAISGLYNTGVDDNGVAVVGTSAVDQHYKIVASVQPEVVGNQAVTNNCCYFSDDATSRWVSIDAGSSQASGVSVYELSFDLSAFDSSTASISGQFAADNHATIFLNGVDTNMTVDSFSHPVGFTLSSGFVSGINTLDFHVLNDGGPEALRVQNLSGTANLAANPGGGAGGVPEPATWALLIGGFSMAGVSLRRRRGQAFAG